MSLLTKNSTIAERQRGLVFVEKFRNESEVLKNGGTIYGNPIINDGALLDGVGDYIRVKTELKNLTIGTLSIWVKATETGDNQGILSKGLVANWHNPFSLAQRYDNVVYGIIGDGSSYNEVHVNNSLIIGKWIHYVFTWDKTTVRLYINGIPGDTESQTVTPVSLNQDLVLGGWGTSVLFKGTLRNLQIFDQALTAQEILDMYNNETYRYEDKAVLNLPMTSETHDPYTKLPLANGDFSTNDTTGWTTDLGGGDGTISASTGQLVMTQGTSSVYMQTYQAVSTVIGQAYTVKLQGVSASAWTYMRCHAGNSEPSAAGAWPSPIATITLAAGVNTLNFTATATTTYIGVENAEVTAYQLTVDNIEWSCAPRTLDISGNNNHATFGDGSTSTTYPTKLTKRGYSLSGDDYFDLGTNVVNALVNGASAITISAIINYTSLTANQYDNAIFVSVIDASASGVWMNIRGDVGNVGELKVGGRSTSGDSFQELDTTLPLLAGIDYHAVGILDFANDEIKIYLNGILVDTASVTFASTTYVKGTATEHDFIGNDYNASRFLTGSIKDVRLWNKALTPLQIFDLYQGGLKQINDV